jgi:hypothetical protein
MDEQLTLRPYNATLDQLTAHVCTQVGQADSDVCRFEARTAFDCVLRNKVRKMGNLTDNVGACKHHIAHMKAALGNDTFLDQQVTRLDNMAQSFC